MGGLAELLRSEFSKSPHVDRVYLSDNELAYFVQLRVEQKRTPTDKGFVKVEPAYLTSSKVSHEVQTRVERVRRKFPGVDPAVVVYRMQCPWRVVYERTT